MITILVNLFGAGLIAATIWFFLGKKEETVTKVQGEITITVDGGYTPNVIQVKKGETTTLSFFRKDPSSCLEEVVIPDLKVRQLLPLDKTTSIVITPKKVGTFDMHCGMNMFHGKIEVID